MSVEQLSTMVQTSTPDEIRAITNNWVVSRGSADSQLDGIEDIIEQVALFSEGLGEVIMEAWAMLVEGGAWKARFSTKEEAIEAFDSPLLRDLRNNNQKSRNRKGKHIKAIQDGWGENVKDWRFERLGENALWNVSCVAKQWTYKQAIQLVVQVGMKRLRMVKSGRGSTRSIISSDWATVKLLKEEGAKRLLGLPPPGAEELESFEMSLAQVQGSIRGAVAAGMAEDLHDGKRRRYNIRSAAKAASVIDDADDEPPEGPLAVAQLSTNDGSDKGEVEEEQDDEESGENKNAEQDDEESGGNGNADEELEETGSKACGCTHISKPLLDRLTRKSGGTSGIKNDAEAMTVLRKLIESAPGGLTLQHVCHHHLRALAAHFGFQVKSLKTPDLRSRLQTCWKSRTNLDGFKTGNASWFRLANRPWVETDDHGVFKNRTIINSLLHHVSDSRAKTIVNDLGGSGTWRAWQEEGNLLLPGMFSWLWGGIEYNGKHEAGVGELIDQEFDMYLHHQTERNAQPNKGWLRTMFFSLTQQVIRQDLGYWAIYACLRPDRNPRLVSYPYYAKYTIPGDFTFFRHIDMNVRMYLENEHGKNIIQGSISLDDENEEGCTEIVPGFHKNIAHWWEAVCSRATAAGGKAPDGPVTGLEKIWTKEDAKNYGDFVRIPCTKGTARITMPEILHGSTMNNGQVRRRTILPWFVGLRDDGQTLDNEESENWADLATAHAGHTACKLTPSGLANRFGPIPYRFPASTQLNLDSPVSNALICQTHWDDPAVQLQANVLLGENRQAAKGIITKHRFKALRAFKEKFAVVKAAEIAYYGEGGFFYDKD
ncbi:hypothetical protein MMC18_009498 [Xylographa bjoerkii]|nr:hypothetical protein [Xylographa bjoerkii]